MESCKPGARIGPYELLSPIGAGGMGEVWKARDTRLDRTVAIKFSQAAFTGRFQQEARAIAALNHPNIATLYDVGENYLVMEFVDGDPIKPPCDSRKLLDIALQIADGLAAAHTAGIVHRDLKPGNILFTKMGRVKILDFGLAKQVGAPGQDEAMTVTQPGTVMGTVAYMSPEQVHGGEADHRSDIFSFGAVLHELASGSRPFDRATPVETMHAILKEDAESVPSSLGQVIAHALEKQPERRFQSAQDLGFALRMSTSGPRVIPEEIRTPRRTWMIGAAAAAAAGAGGYWLGRGRPSRPQASFRKLTFREGIVGNARFTNNGGVVYIAKWGAEPARIDYLSAGDSTARELDFDGVMSLASISSQNELAVTRNGTLARVPLSGGAPREILAGVMMADWSPDGESLAVVQAAADKITIQYPIGNTLAQLKFPPYSLRMSPSGEQVSYTGSSSTGLRGAGFKLAILDRRGKETVLASWVTQGHIFSSVCWTPDGRELWFESPLVSEPGTIYAVDLAGKKRVVTTLPGTFVPQGISRERKVLFRHQRDREGLRGASGGGTERDLTWGERTINVLLSQDGSFCAFPAYEQKQVAYLRRMDGSPAIRLGDGGPISISPDGKWVQLFRTGGNTPSVLAPTGPGAERPFLIERFPARTAMIAGWLPNETYFVNGREEGKPARFYSWNPNGRQLMPAGPDLSFTREYFVDPQTSRCLARTTEGTWMLFPLSGGEPQAVKLSPTQHVAGFTSDGRGAWIATPEADGGAQIGRLDLATGQLTTGFRLQAAPGAAIDPLNVRVSPDGKSYVYIHRARSSELYQAEGLT